MYGAEFGAVCLNMLEKNQSLILDVARLVLGPTSYRKSTKFLLDSLKWLPLDVVLLLASARLSHNIIHTKSPKYLYENQIVRFGSLLVTRGKFNLPILVKSTQSSSLVLGF